MYILYTTPHSFKACDKYIAIPDCSADKLKFCRTDWEIGFITGNSEREKQVFPTENLKEGFLVSGKLQFVRYLSLRIFQFPPTNRRNRVEMTDACELRLAHPAHVLPWLQELIFSTASAQFSGQNRLNM
jgi:hypothetical protein